MKTIVIQLVYIIIMQLLLILCLLRFLRTILQRTIYFLLTETPIQIHGLLGNILILILESPLKMREEVNLNKNNNKYN